MVESFEGSVLDLLIKVRDYVHLGHRLLTHPLSGSLKPGKIPYKTVIMGCAKNGLDQASLQYVESSLEAHMKTEPLLACNWSEKILEDYARVDLSHLEAALAGLDS